MTHWRVAEITILPNHWHHIFGVNRCGNSGGGGVTRVLKALVCRGSKSLDPKKFNDFSSRKCAKGGQLNWFWGIYEEKIVEFLCCNRFQPSVAKNPRRNLKRTNSRVNDWFPPSYLRFDTVPFAFMSLASILDSQKKRDGGALWRRLKAPAHPKKRHMAMRRHIPIILEEAILLPTLTTTPAQHRLSTVSVISLCCVSCVVNNCVLRSNREGIFGICRAGPLFLRKNRKHCSQLKLHPHNNTITIQQLHYNKSK